MKMKLKMKKNKKNRMSSEGINEVTLVTYHFESYYIMNSGSRIDLVYLHVSVNMFEW